MFDFRASTTADLNGQVALVTGGGTGMYAFRLRGCIDIDTDYYLVVFLLHKVSRPMAPKFISPDEESMSSRRLLNFLLKAPGPRCNRKYFLGILRRGDISHHETF
jgi:hypothetical protein